jgi:transitional endoplasmic reticulum ATPase
MEPIQRGLQNLTIKVDAIDANIDHSGAEPGIRIPGSMSLTRAAAAIEKLAEAERAITQINHICRTQHFYCAAWNLQLVLAEQYGIDFASPKPGMFGDEPPQKMTFPLSHDTDGTITIGQFKMEDMTVETAMTTDDQDVPRLRISVSLKNVDEHKATHLFGLLDDMPNPWKGKTLIFDEGREPRSVQIKQSTMTLDQIALNPKEEKAMDLFLHQIRHHEILRMHGIIFNRGILLYGPWGTGKTLAAAIFMAEAEKKGITVLHERSWKRLEQTVALAKSMQPAVVFCEDIDLMQDRGFINDLDDASEKNCEVSLIATTNHPELLSDAFKRTGRVDMSIAFELPETETREKILAINGCRAWSEELGEVTEGMTGSDLAEIGKRARTYSIPTGTPITKEQLVSAALTMSTPPKKVVSTDTAELFIGWMRQNLGLDALGGMAIAQKQSLDSIYEKACEIDGTVDRHTDKLASTYNLLDTVDDKVEALGD